MEFRDESFDGAFVAIDGNTYSGCTFRNCRILYRGSEFGELRSNRFLDGNVWVLEGPAMHTVYYLTALYHSLGDGGREFAERVLARIAGG